MGLLRVFYSPEQVFSEEGKAGKWLLPFVAFLVVSFVLGSLLMSMIDMRAVTRAWLDNHPNLSSKMTSEQINKTIEDAGSPAAVNRQYITRPLISVAVVLILAAVLLGLVKLFGGEIGFKQALTVCAYAMFAYGLVSGAGSCVSLKMMSDPNSADLSNLLKLNPTLFLQEGDSAGARAFHSVLSSLDLLSFWCIFLLALGLTKAGSKLTLGKGLGIVAVPWVVYVVGKAGVTALLAMLGS